MMELANSCLPNYLRTTGHFFAQNAPCNVIASRGSLGDTGKIPSSRSNVWELISLPSSENI